jgi:hypothetical protein
MLTGSTLLTAARENGLVLETFCRPVLPVGGSDGTLCSPSPEGSRL